METKRGKWDKMNWEVEAGIYIYIYIYTYIYIYIYICINTKKKSIL